jgi:small nuclear ribonucleoprotein (snRNP)-like protein
LNKSIYLNTKSGSRKTGGHSKTFESFINLEFADARSEKYFNTGVHSEKSLSSPTWVAEEPMWDSNTTGGRHSLH